MCPHQDKRSRVPRRTAQETRGTTLTLGMWTRSVALLAATSCGKEVKGALTPRRPLILAIQGLGEHFQRLSQNQPSQQQPFLRAFDGRVQRQAYRVRQ